MTTRAKSPTATGKSAIIYTMDDLRQQPARDRDKKGNVFVLYAKNYRDTVKEQASDVEIKDALKANLQAMPFKYKDEDGTNRIITFQNEGGLKKAVSEGLTPRIKKEYAEEREKIENLKKIGKIDTDITKEYEEQEKKMFKEQEENFRQKGDKIEQYIKKKYKRDEGDDRDITVIMNERKMKQLEKIDKMKKEQEHKLLKEYLSKAKQKSDETTAEMKREYKQNKELKKEEKEREKLREEAKKKHD